MALPFIFAGLAAVIQGGAQLFGAAAEADAIRQKAQYESDQLELNAKMSELNASDVLYASGRQLGEVEKYRRSLRAQQQSVLASSNLDTTFGSAAAIQMETETLANLDAITVENNAWREAWGFRFEALQHRKAAALTMITGEKQSSATLLGGAIGAVGTLANAGAKMASLGSEKSNVESSGTPSKNFTPLSSNHLESLTTRRGQGSARFGFGGARGY